VKSSTSFENAPIPPPLNPPLVVWGSVSQSLDGRWILSSIPPVT